MAGVFVGSGIFQSECPAAMARAIVNATTNWQDAEMVAEACAEVLGAPIRGIIVDPTRIHWEEMVVPSYSQGLQVLRGCGKPWRNRSRSRSAPLRAEGR